jgi:hypothetical protein
MNSVTFSNNKKQTIKSSKKSGFKGKQPSHQIFSLLHRARQLSGRGQIETRGVTHCFCGQWIHYQATRDVEHFMVIAQATL